MDPFLIENVTKNRNQEKQQNSHVPLQSERCLNIIHQPLLISGVPMSHSSGANMSFSKVLTLLEWGLQQRGGQSNPLLR